MLVLMLARFLTLLSNEVRIWSPKFVSLSMSLPRNLRRLWLLTCTPTPTFCGSSQAVNSWSAWPRVSTVKPTACNNLFALGNTKKGMQGGSRLSAFSLRSSRYQEAMRPLLRIFLPVACLACHRFCFVMLRLFLYQRHKSQPESGRKSCGRWHLRIFALKL